MRTAQTMKVFAHVIGVAGIFSAFQAFSILTFGFWMVALLSFLLWLFLRLFAAMGQFIFEIKNDTSRMLANIERGLYYSNSLTKEIRDLAEAERIKKEGE
jgi:hypothetical protein